jgi:hypothetical protein
MFWIAVQMRKTIILTRTKMLEVRERGMQTSTTPSLELAAVMEPAAGHGGLGEVDVVTVPATVAEVDVRAMPAATGGVTGSRYDRTGNGRSRLRRPWSRRPR